MPHPPSWLFRGALTISLALGLAQSVPAQVGAPLCFGESCPCGNDDPDAGCGNAGWDDDTTTGARLVHSAGSTNVFADDLTLTVEGAARLKSTVLCMGTGIKNLPVGDGKLCIGGKLRRFPPQRTSMSGTASLTRLVELANINAPGLISPGMTLYFQGIYRDPAGPCGSGFNSTNALPVTFTSGPVETQLAGEPLGTYPDFDFVQAFNHQSAVGAAIDTDLFPALQDAQVDVYVVTARSRSEWDADASLSDVRGAPTQVTLDGTGLAGNRFVVDPGTLPGPTGTLLSASYDLVLDVDRDGTLTDGDVIDGRGDENGFAVFRDLVAPGPYNTLELIHDHGGSFHKQQIFYPENVASLGRLPLIVVSHGNGHNFRWYDHIGHHMASYGYVVMSHQNNTQPGPGAASITTLENTDLFLGNIAQIAAGVLVGHIGEHQIVWIGHSRGAEGVVRAYDRLFDGDYTPTNFGLDDVRMVSSIAPTNFMGPNATNPHDVAYQLWTGSADNDVNGGPSSQVQTYPLLHRGTGERLSVTYYGAGHGAFHNGTGSTVATGPCLVGRGNVHRLMKGYFLPSVRHIVEGEADAVEFLWRNWESIKPIDAPIAACIGVNYEYWSPPDSDRFVVDDFQARPELTVSSSNAVVSFDVEEATEGKLRDPNNSFAHNSGDPMNGMTRANSGDTEKGLVFEWVSPRYIEFQVNHAERNLRRYDYLSFRACQCTRHPNTTAALEDLTFAAILRDGQGRVAEIAVDAYGGGIVEPYQRSASGSGPGIGWSNTFETTRVRLTDFQSGNAELDLTDIVAIRFEFGASGYSSVGRIGLDDIELLRD